MYYVHNLVLNSLSFERVCLERIKDLLALKPLPVCAPCSCEVYLRGQP
jgi:hypothetical protein